MCASRFPADALPAQPNSVRNHRKDWLNLALTKHLKDTKRKGRKKAGLITCLPYRKLATKKQQQQIAQV